MARLSKRERQAKAAWVQARSATVQQNMAGRSSGSKLSGSLVGAEREFRLLSGAARFTSPAALKQHSLTRGCSAPHSGHDSQRIQHATISGLIRGGKAPKPERETFKRWSEQDDTGPDLAKHLVRRGKSRKEFTVGAANAGSLRVILHKV